MATAMHQGHSGARRVGRGAAILLVTLVVAGLTLPIPAAASSAAGPNAVSRAMPAGPAMATAVQAYPRLANLNAFKTPGQVETFARYGLIVAPLSSAADGAVGALKAGYPATRVLAYLNARAVSLPDFGGATIYPGWWLTLAGTTLTAPVDTRATTIAVADAGRIAAHLALNPDVLVGGETMQVVAVNTSTGTLTVRRGYLSAVATHAAGTRVAAHAVAWPGTWMLNVTRYCPVDPATGQTWVRYLAGRAARVLATAPWDGIFYDDADRSIAGLSAGQVDANNDNVADGGNGATGTGWADGMATLFSRTRALAPGVTLTGNAEYYPGASDGREFEHFPYYDGDWNTGFAGYLQVAGSNRAGANIVNPDTGGTGVQDLRAMRFGLGSALMGNGYYAYDYGTTSHGQTWWYDEYDEGAGSSLAAGIDARATTLRVAAGTGRRFRVGDVVRAPSSAYTNAGLTLDDERMRVVAVEGDTLRVARAVGGSLAAGHGAGVKVMTAGQEAAGRGWLGRPLGPARARPLATPDLLAAGFGSGTIPVPVLWDLEAVAPAAAVLAREPTAAAHVSVTAAPGSVPWSVKLVRGTVAVAAHMTYTLSFRARGPAGQRIEALLQRMGAPYTIRASAQVVLDRSWRQYSVLVPAGAGDPALAVQFNLGASHGDTWIDGVSLQQGDANVWRRDFTGGVALLNATNTAQTVELGPGYRHILGTQDPTVNNGAPATSVTLGPRDAVLLIKVSVPPQPIPVPPGPRPLQRPCATGAPPRAITACASTQERRSDTKRHPNARHARSSGKPSASGPLRVPRGESEQLRGAILVMLALAAATVVGISLQMRRRRRTRRM